jgi:hypothetical protein
VTSDRQPDPTLLDRYRAWRSRNPGLAGALKGSAFRLSHFAVGIAFLKSAAQSHPTVATLLFGVGAFLVISSTLWFLKGVPRFCQWLFGQRT